MKRMLLVLAVAGCASAPKPIPIGDLTPKQKADLVAYVEGLDAGRDQALKDTIYIGPTPSPSPTPNAYQCGYKQGYLNVLEGK
jgi:hypothetical protein